MQRIKSRSKLTEGPIFVRLLLFVLPIVATGVLQVMYNMADNIVVGKFSSDGEMALGAVGSTASLTTLIVNFMIGISSGASVVVAQFYGARAEKEVSRTVHTAMSVAVIGGLVFMTVGLVFAKPLLVLMDTKNHLLSKAVLYMTIICIGIPATAIYNFGASVLRSIGDSKTPLIILSLSGIINVLFNLFFVIVCGMSVEGVAIATIISQYISALAVVLVLMSRKDRCYNLDLKKLRIEPRLLKRILRFGLPIAFQSSLFSISNIIITSAVNNLDSLYANKYFGGESGEGIVVSAKTIAFNIEGITYTAMNGFSHAAITFVGQNYGAKKYRRINRIFIYALIQVLATGILVAQLEMLFTAQLADLYIKQGSTTRLEVIWVVKEIFAIMLNTYFLCGVMEVISGVLKGLGFSVSSMVASLMGLAVRVGWIIFIHPSARFNLNNIFGLFLSYTISWIVTIILLLVCCVYAWRKLGIWREAKKERLQEKIKLRSIHNENTY